MTNPQPAVPTAVLRRRGPGWPDLLEQLPDPPALLHVGGRADVLGPWCLAIVGTRRASPRGLAVARTLGAQLAARGWTVVSGLALGIDGAAHRGALDAGGPTVAVMATGPDQTYPAAHRLLRGEIEAAGCTLTECAPGAPPVRYAFPRRNRLIAGLCRGVIVVEAPEPSGALLTAQLAIDHDREVFAVPGPVDLETSRGCHRLLREGAHLLEDAADVERVLGRPATPLDGLGGGSGPPQPVPGSSARWILDRVDLEGTPRDRLRARWPGTEAAWGEGLLALELAGLIRRLPGGCLARTIWR
ncbi:MAG: DNA-protecting protein DprA [Krumholzibacteria bacterium]|nr:DNA-protecting protein DprA [Candidatus Krumholzibacteria bacterium]